MVSPESLILPERYRIRRHIATGGMASVWCAEDLVLGRNVAIKVLAERFAHDQLAMVRFKREARAAARASSHPHVVTVYDVGELDAERDPVRPELALPGRGFIVMEFLAGGTVADAIRHNSISRQESMRWLREAASALDHAHERGIVHRDIKPANFLLDRGRSLHVADFGIARLTTEDTLTTSDQLFGTAAYLSPEQALGREATGASDRYALAVAAFELLVGERPFSAPHFSSQARQHIEEPPPAASERNRLLPSTVDDVFFEALAKRAEDRPASAGRFVTQLADALDGVPSTRSGPPRRGRGRPVDPAAPVPSTAAAQGLRGRSRPDDTRSFSALAADPPHHRRRMLAFGSLGALVLVIAGVAFASLHGGSTPHVTVQADHTASTRHHASTRAVTDTSVTHRIRTRSTPTTTTAATPTVTAAQLQLEGHNEMLAGDYSTAIPTLRQALAADPTTTTKAYALYDLGRSMVLSGQASQAIPILRRRLQIPNQTATVRAMLDQAYADAATGSAPSDGTVSSPSTTTTTTTTTTGPSSGGATPTTGATSSTPTTTPPTTTAPTTGASPTPGPGGAGPGHSGGAGLPGSGNVQGDEIAAHSRARGHGHHGAFGSFFHAVLAAAR